MLRTRENHHDPTSLLFCTLYYLKNIPRIRPRLQRCQQAERSGDALPSGPQPVQACYTPPKLASGGPLWHP